MLPVQLAAVYRLAVRRQPHRLQQRLNAQSRLATRLQRDRMRHDASTGHAREVVS
jgi:hypothetical protein